MECIKCKGKAHKNGIERPSGKQKYKCTDCGCNFTTPMNGDPKPIVKAKVGMTLNDFRDKHDVDHIVQKTLSKLSPGMIYEKNDIFKLTGLRPGYPGLSATVEDAKLYYGKVGSTMYFSHPNTIAELKEQAKLM